MTLRLSPSVNSPNCGGGSATLLRLRSGAYRKGMVGLRTTVRTPSGLECSLRISAPGTRRAWLRPLYSDMRSVIHACGHTLGRTRPQRSSTSTRHQGCATMRSEEHTSELQSLAYLV